MTQTPNNAAFLELEKRITRCTRCPRLREHCEKTAVEKRRAYQNENYWGKPISGFGDPHARLVLIGLAPAAHGANRTGRIFTGDRSGDWLYRALHKAGFANQPTSTARDDGLILKDAYVTCSVRCAPPGNKPLPEEFTACASYLAEEIALLTRTKVYVTLGSLALHALIHDYQTRGYTLKKSEIKFGHGVKSDLPDGKKLLCSYHPSQHNTFTGRLTEPMFDQIFNEARKLIR